MPVPVDFQFSQGSLQDYVDCPRRFQLRYLQHIAWPAVETEPLLENERHIRMGSRFHLLAQQYLLGLPVERLSKIASCSRSGGAELQTWWQNFLSFAAAEEQKGRPCRYCVEHSLISILGNARLAAKYDAIRIRGEAKEACVTILDWKTNRLRSRRAWLNGRLQTRVYMYLIVAAGAHLAGADRLLPAQVEMVYWFAGYPDDPERFIYSEGQFQEDRAYLSGLIDCIQTAGESDYASCADPSTCKYCVYRSLCKRGIKPGSLFDMDRLGLIVPGEGDRDQTEPELDFDQIAEIEF